MLSRKNKILILGSTGMLGNNLENVLKKNNIIFFKTSRKKKVGHIKFNASIDSLDKLPKCEYYINCIGVINKLINKKNIIETININTIFPHRLSEFCNKKKIKLIHISTDCVYSGKKGNYIETDIHDPTDIYGKTKSLGEPTNCMTIRTSIIGEEKSNSKSLVEWVKKQKNKEINGYLNHIWNGLTAKHLSEIILKIIKRGVYTKKLLHLYSEKSVNKYQLIKYIDHKFKLNCKIKKYIHKNSINRSLKSKYNYQKNLKIISIKQQVEEM
tara:strand:- start:1463 stop:2272 length:810 start_codon:yes stop_codon:yes gene_type:complete